MYRFWGKINEEWSDGNGFFTGGNEGGIPAFNFTVRPQRPQRLLLSVNLQTRLGGKICLCDLCGLAVNIPFGSASRDGLNNPSFASLASVKILRSLLSRV